MVEGAVRSGRRKGEGFGERGRQIVRRPWDLQAGLVVQSGPKLDFRRVFFKEFFKRVVASVF